MLDSFEYEDSMLEFFDIQNLYFDHPLSVEEINEFKTVMIGFSSLSQIYFKDDVDIASIEKIKNLLHLSSSLNDAKIEKVITCNLTEEETNYLVNSNFENPDTWSISYYRDGNNFLVDTIPRVREFFAYINKIRNIIRKEKLTPLEKVFRVYDIVKLFDYVDDNRTYSFPDIIIGNKTNSKGFNKLFSYILNTFDIPNYVTGVKALDGKKNYITLVAISDSKYKIDGYYLFDPSMDSLPKDSYKDDIRMMNYNYFGLKLDEFNLNNYGDTLMGLLGILSITDYEYAKEKLSMDKDVKIRRELNRMFTTFRSNLDALHNLMHNVNSIDVNVICNLCDNVYGEKIRKDYKRIVKSNYLDRKKELFKETLQDKIGKMLDKKD